MKQLSSLWVPAFLLLPCLCPAQTTTSVQTSAIPWPTSYTAVSRDANSCIWERTNYTQGPNGQIISQPSSYTELASGLNFKDLTTDQWTPSKEEIDILPDGSAQAVNGQHQAYFPADIGNGVITLTTPDGLQLQIQPVGLSMDDGINTVLIAALTNSVGQLISSNQIIYTNCFIGLDASLLYSYTRSGFEQDVILNAQPPPPESFGLNPATTRLQVLTEFFNPPQPTVTTTSLPDQAGISLTDDTLDFGMMKMIQGRAFLLGTTAEGPPVMVGKQWLSVNGRQFLVEEVPVAAIANQLSQLPAVQTSAIKAKSPLNVVSAKRLLPPPRFVKSTHPRPIQMARAEIPRRGFLLDYQMINSTLTNYTFQGDTTYYISGGVTLSGTSVTFEGGTVIKYSRGAYLSLYTSPVPALNWQASAYRPVIFTAMDDDSVGESISGSTGNPTNYYANPALEVPFITATIANIRVAYAQLALYSDYASLSISDAQFIDCQSGILAWELQQQLNNALFANTATNFVSMSTPTFNVQNVTFSGSSCLGWGQSQFVKGICWLTNCILANVTSLTNGLVQIGGDYNGFYDSTEFGTNFKTNLFYPFQTVGGGNYYLTTNCAFIGVGTANISPALLADLATKTTWPPMVYSNITLTTNLTLSPTVPRDNSGTPSLGYHYDVLDYAFGSVDTTNATITVIPGTAIGIFSPVSGNYGMGFNSGGQLNCEGLANGVIQMAEFNTVQECGTNWFEPTYAMMSSWFDPPQAAINAKFTHWSSMAQDVPIEQGEAGDVENYQNCEFYGGVFYSDSDSLANFTNCLFQRVNFQIFCTSAPTFQNNLFWNGTFLFDAATNALVDDNLFDHTTIRLHRGQTTQSSNAGYNAYVTNCNTLTPVNPSDVILSNSPAYQTNWFGNFYLPTNSTLRYMGSTNANDLSLYWFTTQTNQTPETTNKVSIGYHYVATDANGSPLETVWFGIPNYLADPNGAAAAWQMEYFGHIGFDPTSDPDNDGNNLLYDYTNGFDPNVIQFSLAMTNQYVSNVNVPIQLNVTAGEPFYYTILVDNTNFSSATWNAYTSSNITVNLGLWQGWHHVWVGLRGRPANATQSWQWQQLDLMSPPVLVITNPLSFMVDRPVIQVYGYCQESLSSISYDISNAAGIFINQSADVTDQYFDTNAFGITTNYFDCLDVPLTNGLNTITVHATDLAGDTTTTNFNFTVDYSDKTNPPAIEMTWPQNGTIISGTNFTCNGWISDPTASVLASCVMSNGDTNVFLNGLYTNSYSGEVGRDGNFSFENLPLNTGTNYFTITATDVVGNTSVTNISVTQTNFVLTINPVSPASQLWQPTVTLTGSISDPNYAVWVNGVKGTNYGNGSWSANNVPVSNAVFTTTGYAPNERQPDGSYGN